jgi:hypothetical protein
MGGREEREEILGMPRPVVLVFPASCFVVVSATAASRSDTGPVLDVLVSLAWCWLLTDGLHICMSKLPVFGQRALEMEAEQQ